MTLLRQIQDAALDSKVDLSDLLRKCKVLAARLKHAEFAAWVNHELNGYPDNGSVPDYRRIKVDSQGDFSGPFGSGLRNANIPPSNIDAQFRHWVTDVSFRESVTALAKLAESDALQSPWPADLIKYAQRHCQIYEHMVLMSAWRVIPPSTVSAVLDTVRTRVLDFVLAIEEKEPNAGDEAPGEAPKLARETVSIVYNMTINGGAANIGTTGNASINVSNRSYQGVPAALREEIRSLIEQLRAEAESAPLADRDEAKQTLDRLADHLSLAVPSAERVNNYLGIYASLLTVLSPTLESLKHALSSLWAGQ